MMEFRDLIQRAMHIREQYTELEKARYGRPWTDEEIALGFMGDVGDLAKLIQAREGVRAIPDADTKLAHELADCLWSVIVLAEIMVSTWNKPSWEQWTKLKPISKPQNRH